jgi:hypothetical protein
MEPLLIILVPGLAGGLVLALLIAGRPQRPRSAIVPRRLAAPSPTLINMAHIQVEGIGGLGMVAAAVTVALADPHIRLAMIVALVLGTGLALLLIAMRRGTGALPSGGDGPDNWLTLRLEGDRRGTPAAQARPPIETGSHEPRLRAGPFAAGRLTATAAHPRSRPAALGRATLSVCAR